MLLRKIEITADSGLSDTVAAVSEHKSVLTHWITAADNERCVAHLLVSPVDQQALLDQLQRALSGTKNWRISVLPVEATIPAFEGPKEASSLPRADAQTREELYLDVAQGAQVTRDFLLLVALSTIVAAIGLLTDNVAIVIGAMVIAPLLGPNLALILAAALGDRALILTALRATGIGVALTIALSGLIGIAHGVDLSSDELLTRADVGLGSAALALASGAAAALSVTTGLSTALVGVMVAVALLPPAAAIGLFLGAGQSSMASGAALLLAVNIASVNLAGQIVFLFRGIRPRTWLERRSASQSTAISVAVWIGLLIIVLTAAFVRSQTQ